MIKSFQNLKSFFPNIYYNICLEYIYNLVEETWLDYFEFKLLDNIILFIKASFIYCLAYKKRWINYLSLNAISNSSLSNNFYQEIYLLK